MYELVPLAAPLSNRPLIWIGGRTGVCLASRQIVQCATDGCFAWQAAIRWETDSGLRPGHIVWEEARCILLGFGSEMRALAVGDGEELLHVAVGDYVGSLALTPDAASALVLTGTDVLAFDRRLKQIWQATNLAIDGVCIEELRDDAVLLNAEMAQGRWPKYFALLFLAQKFTACPPTRTICVPSSLASTAGGIIRLMNLLTDAARQQARCATRKVVFAIAGLCVAACSQGRGPTGRPQYPVPPAEARPQPMAARGADTQSGGPLHAVTADDADWAHALVYRRNRWQEKVLSETARAGYEAYRMWWDPGRGPAIMVRVEKPADGPAMLIAKRLARDPIHFVAETRTAVLDDRQWGMVRQYIAESGFWHRRAHLGEIGSACDGNSIVVEGVRGALFHVADWEYPVPANADRLGDFLVYLSDIERTPQDARHVALSGSVFALSWPFADVSAEVRSAGPWSWGLVSGGGYYRGAYAARFGALGRYYVSKHDPVVALGVQATWTELHLSRLESGSSGGDRVANLFGGIVGAC